MVVSPSFKQKTTSSILWALSSNVAQQAVGFAIGLVLARLLGPQIIGLLALVMVFSGFAGIFTDVGLSSALVQKKEITDAHLDSVFLVNVGASLAISVVFFFAAPLIADFYDEPSLVLITQVLAFQFVLGASGNVHNVILRRELNFRALSILDLVSTVLAGAVGISMALGGFGVWSLVAQAMSGTAMRVLGMWLVSGWRPRFRYHHPALLQLWRFGANLLGFHTTNYLFRNADNLLIGRFLGPTSLGLYSKAYNTMSFPLSNVTGKVGQVMFPALSQIQDEPERVASIYLRVARSIALITFPMMVGVTVVAAPFVLFLYGPEWEGMIPLLQVFAMVGALRSISALSSGIFQSQGRADLQFRVGGTMGLVGIGAIVLGLKWGVLGVAVSYSVYYAVALPISIHIAVSLVGLSLWVAVKNLLSIGACSLGMGVLVWIVGVVLRQQGSALPILFFSQVGMGVLAYWLAIHSFRLEAYRDTLGILRETVPLKWKRQNGGGTGPQA